MRRRTPISSHWPRWLTSSAKRWAYHPPLSTRTSLLVRVHGGEVLVLIAGHVNEVGVAGIHSLCRLSHHRIYSMASRAEDIREPLMELGLTELAALHADRMERVLLAPLTHKEQPLARILR